MKMGERINREGRLSNCKKERGEYFERRGIRVEEVEERRERRRHSKISGREEKEGTENGKKGKN